jgi:hypothetical protein
MNANLVTFARILGGLDSSDDPGSSQTNAVEIPIIQRDYAQGRVSPEVQRIRGRFLDALHAAVSDPNAPIRLDFVYGEVVDRKLVPLDGQQRLTTLFLLHWYAAAKQGVAEEDCAFLTRFSYETRFSSRSFCAQLVRHRPLLPTVAADGTPQPLAEWVCDQPWFFKAWQRDPTVQAMLVVLEEISRRFYTVEALWDKLVHADPAPISFYFLALPEMGLTEELYVKMNSRGMPLTPFEQLKAELGGTIAAVSDAHKEEFKTKVDGAWTDMLWQMQPEELRDGTVDKAFVRYFRFVSDTMACRDGDPAAHLLDLLDVPTVTYGPGQPCSLANQRALFDALDCWCDPDSHQRVAEIFVKGSHIPGKTTLFDKVSTDLLQACCDNYSGWGGRDHGIGLQEILLLRGVVTHLVLGRAAALLPGRMRTLRNLVANSDLRAETMASHLAGVHDWVATGALDGLVPAFSAQQRAEELAKLAFLDLHPEFAPRVARLEDHELLRGCIGVFAFEPVTFGPRLEAFERCFAKDSKLFPLVTRALLAVCDYGPQQRGAYCQYGFTYSADFWRRLLTGTRTHFAAKPAQGGALFRKALEFILDTAIGGEDGLIGRLSAIGDDFLAERSRLAKLDWRYYFARYGAIRESPHGIFYWIRDFQIVMLLTSAGHGYKRDPFLWAIYNECRPAPGEIEDPRYLRWLDDTWTPHGVAWMKLVKSDTRVACVTQGFRLQAPLVAGYATPFEAICRAYNVTPDLVVPLPQWTDAEGVLYDQIDRVELGARLVRDLLAM